MSVNLSHTFKTMGKNTINKVAKKTFNIISLLENKLSIIDTLSVLAGMITKPDDFTLIKGLKK
jgi:hypothetical protein